MSDVEEQPLPNGREKRLAVMEIFGPTIQGEGLVAGQQTLFIRFGGCDYRCTKCDSLHAVIPEKVQEGATYMTVDEIMEQVVPIVQRTGVRWVTFSGGNPAMHQLAGLVDAIHSIGMGIAVETQGTLWAPWIMACDIVTVSPKGPGMGEKFEQAKFERFLHMLAGHPGFTVKVVIMDQRDIEFAASLLSTYNYLQGQDRFWLSLGNPMPPPADEGVTETPFRLAELIMHYQCLLEDILQDPRVKAARVLPQVHVLIWGNKKGV
jgi:7-carboxy-7-deazaguanine synthase